MFEKLLKKDDDGYWVKDIEMLEGEKVKNLSPKTLQILRKLAEEESYPKEIAEEMGLHEQKVYYHVNKLKEMGLIEVSRKEKKGGATSKFYRSKAGSFGFKLDEDWQKINFRNTAFSDEVMRFFSEFLEDGVFKGSIVVGSSKEHGPFLTAARDGHYAVQLGMFLGNFCDLEDRFVVKLDTEVKAEEALDRDLILIGGPVTNIVSRELNEDLEVSFDWEKTWKVKSGITGKEYTGENIGLIAKVHRGDYTRVMLSGLHFAGTKTCILALTQEYDRVLDGYESGEDFYRVIRGLDRVGDGKIDDIEVLE